MVLMKAAMKRAGAGNTNPPKREPFPDVDHATLEDGLDGYIRLIGVKEAFNLYEYRNLQSQQAEEPKALFRLHRLISCLLTVSPTGQIKYKALRQGLTSAVKRFGKELLADHWAGEHHLLAGSAADALGVLLKHWRRVTKSTSSWQKFGTRLESSQFKTLERLYKMMEGKAKVRKLKKEFSDVTVDEEGWPAMLGMVDDEETEEEACEESDAESSEVAGSAEESALAASPPPVLKKHWKELAGKTGVAKKPSGKVSKEMKKPVAPKSIAKGHSKSLEKGASSKSLESSGKSSTSKEKDHDIKVDVASLSMGGGTNQSYIQHQPEGKKGSKRLIAACTLKQASGLKLGHRKFIEKLCPHCKAPNATKGSVLKARDELFTKYKK